MSPRQVTTHEVIGALRDVNKRLSHAFGVVILVLMLIVLMVGGYYITHVIEREEGKLSTALTRILASSVSRVSFSGRYHAQLLIDDIQTNQPNLSYIRISDFQGVVLAATDRVSLDKPLPDTAELLNGRLAELERRSRTRRLRQDGEHILEITLPYRGGFDHSIQGLVQVGLSMQSRDEALKEGVILMVLVLLGLLTAGIVTVRQLSNRFGTPIQHLASDMAATLQAMPDLLFEIDRDGRYLQVLAYKEELLAAAREQLLGKTFHDVLPEPAARVVQEAIEEADLLGGSHGRQIELELPIGKNWFELSVSRKEGTTSVIPSYIVISRDITERKRTEQALYLYANVFEHSGEAIMITDRNNRIISINPALSEYTGYTLEELMGRNPSILSSGQTADDVYRQMWLGLETAGYWQGELWDRRKSGETYPKWVSISAIRDDNGNLTHYIASYTDITDRKLAEERIDYVAHHDVLTGLLNRFSLEERLEQVLLNAHREMHQVAVMFIDMDRFKDINDTLGHHTGDAMLFEIGRRIKSAVRESDIVARLGGDEFVIVLSGAETTPRAAATLANKIVEHLRAPYQVEESILHSTPSIGISLYPKDGDSVGVLMKHADSAMYHAKEKGGDTYQFFTRSMNVMLEQRMTLENSLRVALDLGQFQLFFQPICNGEGEVRGLEALLRWHRQPEGAIPPDIFIPVAESTGLILPLGRWVLEEACRLKRSWKERGIVDLPLSVNISVNQLYSSLFIDQVKEVMERNGIGEGELIFEITESTAMRNIDLSIDLLKTLRDLGVRIAIDDFGTGYSSLAYLKRLPIDSLKLDRTFVDDICRDEYDASISAATIALAHNLGLTVVAEGVETREQRDFLMEHQCDLLQGYLFSRPLPVAETEALIARKMKLMSDRPS